MGSTCTTMRHFLYRISIGAHAYGYGILLSESDLIGYTILYILIYDSIYFSLLYHVMMTCFDDMTWESCLRVGSNGKCRESWNPLMYFHDLNRDVPPKPRQYLENFLLGEI